MCSGDSIIIRCNPAFVFALHSPVVKKKKSPATGFVTTNDWRPLPLMTRLWAALSMSHHFVPTIQSNDRRLCYNFRWKKGKLILEQTFSFSRDSKVDLPLLIARMAARTERCHVTYSEVLYVENVRRNDHWVIDASGIGTSLNRNFMGLNKLFQLTLSYLSHN